MSITRIYSNKTLFIAMVLVIPLAVLTTAQAAKSGNQMVEAIILSYQSEAGKLSVQAKTGEKLVLAVSPDVDLSIFKKGDRVIIEYSKDMVLQTIKKQG